MRLAATVTAAAVGGFLASPASNLQVLRVAPSDPAEPTAVVTVAFDRPVAGQLDATVDPRSVFTITPAAAGRVEWRDPITLRFTPAQPLSAGTRFTVTIANTFRAMDGSRLENPYRFSFRVSGPRRARAGGPAAHGLRVRRQAGGRTWPLIGALVRRARHPTVDRWDPQRSVADTQPITEEIRRGERVLFFPEGTFTAATGLRSFRLGAFEAAVATGTPVVPLALRGTRRVLRDGEWLPQPGAISLWVGPPIAPAGTEWKDVIALRDKVAEAIAAHCGEPRLELVAGRPLRA